ncbi:MAG: hypothetical protein H5T50_00250 [Nitrososphaeria archaeon]|nr:hypothetical protein [Nitrososphaeria archaeon]
MSLEKNFKLYLDFSRRRFVRGESIPVKVCLENVSEKNFLLDELEPLSDSLYFRILGKTGFKGSFSMRSWLSREGKVLHPYETKTFMLDAKGKKCLELDLIKILGELPEDLYKIKATYTSHGILFIDSNIVQVKIVPSNPVYISSPRDYLRYDCDPIYSVWISRQEEGYFLYFMKNSPNFPKNIWYNKRVTRLDKPCEAYAALPENYDQQKNCIVWSEKNVIFRCVVEDEKFSIEDFKLPFQVDSILEPQFFCEDGTLITLAYSFVEDHSTIYLIIIEGDGSVQTRCLKTFKGRLDEYTLVFDERTRAHLVYTIRGSNECYYIEIFGENLEKEREQMLFRSRSQCFALQLSNNCLDESGERILALHYLTLEDDRLNAHILNVNSKAEVKNIFLPIRKELELKCIDVILDENCSPHHLFQDKNGILWYQPAEGGMIRASEENEVCPGNIDFPKLILSSSLSRHHGIFIRYVKDKKNFVYKKLEDL